MSGHGRRDSRARRAHPYASTLRRPHRGRNLHGERRPRLPLGLRHVGRVRPAGVRDPRGVQARSREGLALLRTALCHARVGRAEPRARRACRARGAGLVRAIVTQNIDLLHQRAGSRDVVEVHGSIRTSSCPGCGARFPLAEVEPLIEAHGAPPCPACGAILKPDVVFFDELLPEAAILRAVELAETAALLLVVGSSLEVYPVADLPRSTLVAGGKVAVVEPDADVGGRPQPRSSSPRALERRWPRQPRRSVSRRSRSPSTTPTGREAT